MPLLCQWCVSFFFHLEECLVLLFSFVQNRGLFICYVIIYYSLSRVICRILCLFIEISLNNLCILLSFHSLSLSLSVEDVVECKMDLKNGTGSLACRMCSASYSMPIHHLHEPVDVFSEWLDDCEAAERGEIAPAPPSHNNRGRGDMSKVVHDTSQDYDDDDDESEGLPEPSGLGQTNKNKKRAAEEESDDEEEGGGGKKQKATTATLGLDESDDDDDDSD
ncbi:hypothetical protein ACHAXM_002182 [Skeletonema potamos]